MRKFLNLLISLSLFLSLALPQYAFSTDFQDGTCKLSGDTDPRTVTDLEKTIRSMTITTQGNLQEKEVYIRISGSPGDEGKIISNRLYSNSALDWYPFPVSGGNVTITNLVEEGYVLDSGQQSRSFFKAQT